MRSYLTLLLPPWQQDNRQRGTNTHLTHLICFFPFLGMRHWEIWILGKKMGKKCSLARSCSLSAGNVKPICDIFWTWIYLKCIQAGLCSNDAFYGVSGMVVWVHAHATNCKTNFRNCNDSCGSVLRDNVPFCCYCCCLMQCISEELRLDPRHSNLLLSSWAFCLWRYY